MHHKMLALVAGAAISALILAPDMALARGGSGVGHGAVLGWRYGWGWGAYYPYGYYPYGGYYGVGYGYYPHGGYYGVGYGYYPYGGYYGGYGGCGC
jgi:hypothetical protein